MDPPAEYLPAERAFQVICKWYAVACAAATVALGCSPVSAKFDELRVRLAEINDLGRTMAILGWDQETMMPPRGAPVRAEQLATLEPHHARAVHLARDRPPARRARGLRAGAADRLVRGEPDPRRAPRLGEGVQGAVRAARRDVALRLARAAVVGGGARAERLRAVPARPAAEPRPPPALHRVLRRRLRRAVRRRCSTTTSAGMKSSGGADAVRVR